MGKLRRNVVGPAGRAQETHNVRETASEKAGNDPVPDEARSARDENATLRLNERDPIAPAVIAFAHGLARLWRPT